MHILNALKPILTFIPLHKYFQNARTVLSNNHLFIHEQITDPGSVEWDYSKTTFASI